MNFHMIKMLRRTVGEDIRLQFKFAMQRLFVHADLGVMDQVLMNLAVDARGAMPKGGLLIYGSLVECFQVPEAHEASLKAPAGLFVSL
jgi:hypothetical protein